MRTAREREYPCLGYVACVWNNRTEGVEDSAICSWRAPVRGEARYEPLD